MTAFARAETKIGHGRLVVEIRSVNHRHLLPAFRLARELSALEPIWRERLQQHCSRGKVDVSAHFHTRSTESPNKRLNPAQLRRLIGLSRRLFTQTDPAQLLALDAVWSTASTSPETLKPAAQQSFDEALELFIAQRDREGSRLTDLLTEQLDHIAELVAELCERRLTIQKDLQTRLKARLEELQASLDPQRLEEEVTVQVMRADVDEELGRLGSHLTETRSTMEASGAQGRKLDFLMQEFMRETNTLASKALDIDTTNSAMNLKITIEQMREQIQNIE